MKVTNNDELTLLAEKHANWSTLNRKTEWMRIRRAYRAGFLEAVKFARECRVK